MAFNYSPRIVTNDLVLYLDAANIVSYPSSGTTWRDLTPNANIGTLTNGPVFTRSFGGIITFAGDNDYVVLTNTVTSTIYSIDMWYRMGTSDNSFGYFISSGNNGLAINEGASFAGQTFGTLYYYNGSTVNNLANIPSTTAWNHIVAVLDTGANNIKIYGNGNPTPLSNTTVTSISTSITNIGRYITGNTNFLKGDISSLKIYSRALTTAEILQNYNALKVRFGL